MKAGTLMTDVGANNTLTNTLGRSPTVTDTGGHLGISEEEVLEGPKAPGIALGPAPAQLDEPGGLKHPPS